MFASYLFKSPLARVGGARWGGDVYQCVVVENTLVSGVVRGFIVCNGVEGVVHSRLGGVKTSFDAFQGRFLKEVPASVQVRTVPRRRGRRTRGLPSCCRRKHTGERCGAGFCRV